MRRLFIPFLHLFLSQALVLCIATQNGRRVAGDQRHARNGHDRADHLAAPANNTEAALMKTKALATIRTPPPSRLARKGIANPVPDQALGTMPEAFGLIVAALNA